MVIHGKVKLSIMISHGPSQGIAKVAEQKLLRRVELGGVSAISSLNSPKIGTPWTSPWTHVDAAITTRGNRVHYLQYK